MIKPKLLSAVFHLLFTILSLKSYSQSPASFSLTTGAKTSAGVYKFDGTDDILIKTLWSGEYKAAGTHSLVNVWDGKDDAGVLQPADGTYKIKVVSNNLTDDWGIIGQTSPQGGATIWRGHNGISSMAFVGTKAYVAAYYQEGQSARMKFDISNPQMREPNIQDC